MGSVLPVVTLYVLLVSHVCFASVLPEPEHIVAKREISGSSIVDMYDEGRVRTHTPEEKEAILNLHNDYRSNTSPQASNMEYLEWDEDLATIAGLWASVCYWGHGTPNVSLSADIGNMGQNLWLGGSEPAGTNVVTAWHNEKQHYTYSTKSCADGKVCGHYTQVVWAKTTKVGCSRAQCSVLIDQDGVETDTTNVWIEACQYYPRGNAANTKPYQKGTPCSSCLSKSGWCYDNMCRDCTALEDQSGCECTKTCHNCGSVNANCMCDCVGGWYGDDCSNVCEDWHKYCNTSPGWPNANYCDAHPGIPDKCPVMCSVCSAENECDE